MTHSRFRRNYSWQAKYDNEVRKLVKHIIEKHNLSRVRVRPASNYLDTHEATDLVYTADLHIAVRLRRATCLYRDLTLRSKMLSGRQAELAKIKQGFVDYSLYGWVRDDKIAEWIFVDYDKLRASGLLEKKRKMIQNIDRETWFVAITIPELLAAGCIVESAGALQKQKRKNKRNEKRRNSAPEPAG